MKLRSVPSDYLTRSVTLLSFLFFVELVIICAAPNHPMTHTFVASLFAPSIFVGALMKGVPYPVPPFTVLLNTLFLYVFLGHVFTLGFREMYRSLKQR